MTNVKKSSNLRVFVKHTFIKFLIVAAATPVAVSAQSKLPPDATRTFSSPTTYAPDLAERVVSSELRDVIPRYTSDRQLLLRFYTVAGSRARLNAEIGFNDSWGKALEKLDFDKLSQEGKPDLAQLAQGGRRHMRVRGRCEGEATSGSLR